MVELRFRYGEAVVRRSPQPFVLDDAAPAARRVPARRGARARRGGARGRRGQGRAPDNVVLVKGGESFAADVIVGRRRRERDHRQGGRARRRDAARRRVRGERRRTRVIPQKRYEHRVVIELADIPGGYGVGLPEGRPRERRRRLLAGGGAAASASTCGASCEAHDLDPSQLENLRGHRLPLRMPETRLAGERALLVGDAAGLLDPVSGDGMYECFSRRGSRPRRSSICSPAAPSTLEPYEAAVDAALSPAAPRLVEAEAGARPLAARLVARGPHRPLLAQHRGAAPGRARRSRASNAASRACRCARSRILGRS